MTIDFQDAGPKITHFLLLIVLFLAAFFYQPLRESSNEFLPGTTAEAVVIPEQEIPDFASITDVEEKKEIFFDFLMPYIEITNEKILDQRERLEYLLAKVTESERLSRTEISFLNELSVQYEIESGRVNSISHINRLLKRVDVIPPSLVLVQAANESAWGTSRFATEGNNFFGQWCYTKGCGMVPGSRRSGDRHEVRSFDSILDSVEAYFMNLNTFHTYQPLRDIRLALRDRDLPIDGITLSEGLNAYSERGDEYVEELQSMIYSNNLQMLDQV